MILQIVCSAVATLGFAVLFNIRGKAIIIASLGGGVGWLVYLVSFKFTKSVVFSSFIASFCISIYSEIAARIFSKPATVFIVCAIIPLVPGAGMYYTMFENIKENFARSLSIGSETLYTAGAIAVGIALVSALSRMVFSIMSFIRKD
jgi:uncharacterized membrane protein YjjB (DUF3815 family)